MASGRRSPSALCTVGVARRVYGAESVGSRGTTAALHDLRQFVGGHTLAASQFSVGIGEPTHRLRIAQDRDGLFELLQIIDGEQDCRRTTMHRDRDSLMLIVDTADQFGKVALHLGQWQRRGHGHKYDQNEKL